YTGALDEVWDLVSNTDAFNRVAGFGLRFSRDDEGRMIGRMRAAGSDVTWEERPIDYCHASWFTSQRDYDNGAVRAAEVTCRFAETEGGAVEVDYRLELQARFWLLTPLLWLIGRLVVRRQLVAGFANVERALRGGRQLLDPPPALGASAREAMEAGLAAVDPALRTSLRNRLEKAPLVVQDRLRPGLVARQDGHDPARVELAMLQGVRAGLLELRWLVLCPRCRGDETDRGVVDLATRDQHCPSCGIRYDGALVDNVEAVFRPAPAIRTERAPVDCVMSPSRTPHVLVQCPVGVGEELGFHVTLKEGTYVLEAGDVACLVQVREGGPDVATLHVEVGPDGAFPQSVVISPRKVDVRVTSHLDARARVAFSRRWRPTYGLTASRLLSTPELAALLPEAMIAPGAGTRSYRESVLVLEAESVDGGEEALAALEDLADVASEAGNLLLVAAFRTIPAVLAGAEALAGLRLPLRGAIGAGVVLELEQEGQKSVVGQPVEEALEVVRSLAAPQLALATDEPEVLEALADNPAVVQLVRLQGHPAVLAFAASIDGPSVVAPREAAVPELLDVPEVLGAFEVVREIDSGASGRVLEVLDRMDSTRFALKTPLRRFQSDAEMHAFLREGLVAKRVRHPNVVGFRDLGVENGQPYLVMEYLEGRPLAARLELGGPLSVRRTTLLLAALLDGLEAVHDAGLVHRDIKPSNIFLLDDPKAARGGV
ncbi:MAG: protein kinase, partial [Myxococcales bacterium]|nr:protein kinase [Myxococcales bacterium]